MTPRSVTWLRLSVVYFFVAVALGIWMGASGNHMLLPVHAHLNLLGWVSMAIFWMVGQSFPGTQDGPMARVQFWLYNLGVPVMLASLALRIHGRDGLEPLIGVASMAIGVSVFLFGWLVMAHARLPHTR
jgi:hypothetical protein